MIQRIKSICKRVIVIIGILLGFVILSGIIFRIFGPGPHEPFGHLVDVNGVQLHIHSTGDKSDQPTLVIEAGAGLSTEYYHWLSEGLKDSMRVVRYDRSGLGYSESTNETRSVEKIARELHSLLEEVGESPPYILAGHSLGGIYIRVFAQLYPDDVVGLVFIDSTHPEQVERFHAAPESSFRYKSALWGMNVATVLADLGIVGLIQTFTGPLFAGEGLPDEMNKRTKDYLINGKCLRGYKSEIQNYHSGLRRARQANDFGDKPIRVFTAIEIDRESYKKRGIDPDEYLHEKVAAHNEFADLSSEGKLIEIDGNHQTIFTKKENADIICKEIMRILELL